MADEALTELLDFLASGAAVDRYLADQLLLPLCLADGPSSLSAQAITGHLLTNADILRSFLPVRIRIEGPSGLPGRIDIFP